MLGKIKAVENNPETLLYNDAVLFTVKPEYRYLSAVLMRHI